MLGRRRVAASAPVLGRTLAMLHEVDALAPSVPSGGGRRSADRPGSAGAAGVAARGQWRTDSFTVVLDRRSPSCLGAGDPWMDRGRAALWSYRMVDPRVVRGAWWADQPLLGRRIVQEGRFGPLRLRMATEVVVVVDGVVEVGGRVATVAGFEYRTLEGHLEDGWQSWQLWRWHDTGVLEHRGHTTSRRGDVASPVIDLGMRVFGRMMQLVAGRLSTRRLAAFVAGATTAEGPTRGAAGASTGSSTDGSIGEATGDVPVPALASLPGARLLDDVPARSREDAPGEVGP